MFESFFDDIKEINKKFIDYINLGKFFFASEEELGTLIDYYSYKKDKFLEEKATLFALKLYPNSSILLTKKGIQYFFNGKLDEAIKYLQKAYIYDLENIESIIYLFIAYARKKEFDKAKSFFEKLENFVYEEPDTILDYAEEIFFNVFDQENILEQFVNKNFTNIDEFLAEHIYTLYNLINNTIYNCTLELCYNRMAFCLSATKKFNEAKKHLEKSIQIDPYSIETWIHLSLLEWIQNNNEAALKYIDYAVAIEPNSRETHLILIHILISLNRHLEAINLLETLSKNLFAEDAKIYHILAECYASIGNMQVAIDYLENYLSIEPYDIDALIDIASIYIETKDFKKASYYIKKLKNKENENIEIQYLFANYYLKKEQYNLGLKYINKALREKPDELDFILLKSELLEAKGNIIESINFIKTYASEKQNDYLILYKMAGLYVLNKQISKAYKYLKMAIDKDSLFVSEFLKLYPQAKEYNELKDLLNLS